MSEDLRGSVRVTWVLITILVLMPAGVLLATALPYAIRVNPRYTAPIPMVLDALATSATLPSGLLAAFMLPLGMLPPFHMHSRLPRRTALTLGVLLLFLS